MSTQPAGTSGPSNSSDSLSAAELIAQLTVSDEIQDDQVPDQNDDDDSNDDLPDGEEFQEESESDDPEPQEEPDEIEQLLSTDPERLKEIARQAGSKSLSRFAELTAKNKALEAQLQNRQPEAKPLPAPLEDNPFRGLDAKQVEDKRKELEKVVDAVEVLLDEHDDYGPDDLIAYGGKEYKKKDLKTALRNSNKSLSKFIPDQLAEIQRIDARLEQKEVWKQRLVLEIPAMADESSELSQKHRVLMDQPIIQQMIANTPDFAPLAEHFVGHALNSILMSTKKTKPAPGSPPRPKVSGSPVGAVATPTRTDTGAKVKDKEEKFMKSGRADDLVALFASQTR